MTKALIITLFSLISVVSFAQQDEDYNIETIERNISRSHENESEDAQDEYNDAMSNSAQSYKSSSSKSVAGTSGKNEAYDTQNSPQINIYNENVNTNRQHQKAMADAVADSQSDSAADAQATNDVANTVDVDAEVGNEYVSRANDIRKARKNLEVGTEQKMIEKIEWSRMEDEKDRADRLFGNRLDKSYGKEEYKKEEPKVIVVEKPTYVAPVQAEPAYVAPAKPAAPAYEVKAEKYESATPSWWGEEVYLAPMVGSVSYDADNVRPDSLMGVTLGARLDSNISLEGSFLYGELEMDDYRLVGTNGYQLLNGLKDVTQYTFGGAVKYNFAIGRFSPFLGAVASYTSRDYQETRLGSGTAESTAVDAGLALGADVKIAKNFSVGVEYRIMKNITNDRDDSSTVQYADQRARFFFPQQTAGKSMEPLEEVGQNIFLVNGKFSF